MSKILRIPGAGFSSNVYVVQDEKTAVIDAGMPEDFEYVLRAMRKNDLDRKVDFLLNTHCHYDHAGGDFAFVRFFGCEVLIHREERQVIEKGDDFVSCACMFGGKLMPVKISRELENGDEISLGGWTLRVLHTPGHTAGSVCILLQEEGVLFSGDTVFADGFGRTDLPTGSSKDLLRSLRRLLSEPFERLFPGHGEISENGKESVKRALELAELYEA